MPSVQSHSKILVIDDDALVRESLCAYLEDSGYEVIAADGGAAGLDRLANDKVDIVLCDLRMPDMNGLDVLRTTSSQYPDLPVIVISGAGMVQDVVAALRLGAVDYLVKPITDLTILEHAVETALKQKNLEFENKKYREELEAANQELAHNLKLLEADQKAGRQAQLQLLPEPKAKIGPIHFEHAIFPSLYLSGDFLDYFEIDEGIVGFYMADVSGHGSASAFVTMMLKSLVNQPLRDFRNRRNNIAISPDQMCAYLNEEILASNLGKYLTIFYGVIDYRRMTLKFCNAGHYPPPLLRNGYGECESLVKRGFPIGLFPWATYESAQIELDKQFSLGIFSDGVLEILSAREGEAAPENRLKDICTTGQISVRSVVSKLGIEELEALPDDVSIFLIWGGEKHGDGEAAIRD